MKNLASFLLSVMLICFSACSNNDDLVEVRQQVTPLKNLVRSTTFNYQGKNYTSEFNYTNVASAASLLALVAFVLMFSVLSNSLSLS